MDKINKIKELITLLNNASRKYYNGIESDLTDAEFDKMFDKAIDVPGLAVLINCVPFASQVKAEQVIGRLRYQSGKTCLMIDIGDFGFTECQRQYKLRKRFYKKHAKTISEIKNY